MLMRFPRSVRSWICRTGTVSLCRLLLVVYWPVLFLGTHWPQLQVTLPEVELPTDKVVHFSAFAVLGFLLILSLKPEGRRSERWHPVVATLLGILYACFDEWTQGYVVGRTFDWADMFANVAGVLSAAWLLERRAITAFFRAHRVGLARLVLVGVLPVLAYFGFQPGFNWYHLDMHHFLRALGWPRGRIFPYEQLAHWGAAMVLTWLLPAARVLGGRWPRAEAAILVGLVAVSAFPIEYIQVRIGRSWEMQWNDVLWHQVGVASALVIWALVRGMYVPPRPRRRSEEAVTKAAAVGIMAGSGNAGGGSAITTDSGASAAHDAVAPTDSPEPESAPSSNVAFVGHAVTVSTLTLISRLTGVVRDAVMGAVFGLTGVMGAFTIGFMVPNLFRRLFGEGALTAAFIPAYTEQLKKNPQLARRMASLCIGVLLVVTGGLTLLGMGLLDVLAASREWSASAALAIELSRIMLPFMPMVCLVALLGGILQVHGRFGPAAAAPIIVNLVMIAAALLATTGFRTAMTSAQAEDAIRVVAWSVLLAGAIQVVWQAAAASRVESFTVRCLEARAALKPVILTMVPMVLGLAVFQINALLDTLIAFALAPPDQGGTTFHLLGREIAYPIASRGDTAALAFAQRLYQFPLGVFGIAVATAIFPALSHAAAEREGNGPDDGAFRTILQHGLRLTVFIGLPAAVGLILVRVPLTRAIFEYYRFDRQDSLRVASVLAGYSVAIWAYSMTHVLTRAFYAVKDAKTPLRVSMGMVGFNLALNLVLVWPLGVAALAWSTSFSAMVQAFLLLRKVRRYVDRPVDDEVWRGWVVTACLTAAMTAVLGPILWWVDPAGLSRPQSLGLLALLVTLGMAVYLLGAWLVRSEELGWLLRRR